MPGEGSFGHAGAGGRMGFAHPENSFAVASVCNNMLWDSQTSDPRWVGWTQAQSDKLAHEGEATQSRLHLSWPQSEPTLLPKVQILEERFDSSKRNVDSDN